MRTSALPRIRRRSVTALGKVVVSSDRSLALAARPPAGTALALAARPPAGTALALAARPPAGTALALAARPPTGTALALAARPPAGAASGAFARSWSLRWRGFRGWFGVVERSGRSQTWLSTIADGTP